MAASRESIQKIKELEDKRHTDSEARKEWEKLVRLYDRANSTLTPANPKGQELKSLLEALAQHLDARKKQEEDDLDDCGGCNDNDSSLSDWEARLAGIDMDDLAQRVFERLIFEVRVERDRVGWSA